MKGKAEIMRKRGLDIGWIRVWVGVKLVDYASKYILQVVSQP
jgi:hypothetical protein